MQKINGKDLIKEFTLDDLEKYSGSEITLNACVHKIRSGGSFYFVMLRTGRYIVQSTYSSKICKGSLHDLSEGAYVKIKGIVKEETRANYGYEITLTSFEILSKPFCEYPLNVSENQLGCTIETNMEHRSVALRHPNMRAVLKISEGIVQGFREFMMSRNFTEIHTPKITTIKEDDVNTFKLRYFDKDAFLSHSPQFYKQACVAFFDRVFEVSKAYRAEKHNSTRHLCEYTRLDFEMGYINSIFDIMQVQTALLHYICEYLSKNYSHEIELLNADVPSAGDIPTVTFKNALDFLGKDNTQLDLDPTDEVKLFRYAKENFDSDFIFVTNFPSIKRPFYIMDSPDDENYSESFVLLFRGMEIAKGSQNIHDYNTQIEKAKRYNIDLDEMKTYLDIQKYGMPPHGGMGIGLERLLMQLLGLDNIRYASLFPRDMHHLLP